MIKKNNITLIILLCVVLIGFLSGSGEAAEEKLFVGKELIGIDYGEYTGDNYFYLMPAYGFDKELYCKIGGMHSFNEYILWDNCYLYWANNELPGYDYKHGLETSIKYYADDYHQTKMTVFSGVMGEEFGEDGLDILNIKINYNNLIYYNRFSELHVDMDLNIGQG